MNASVKSKMEEADVIDCEVEHLDCIAIDCLDADNVNEADAVTAVN